MLAAAQEISHVHTLIDISICKESEMHFCYSYCCGIRFKEAIKEFCLGWRKTCFWSRTYYVLFYAHCTWYFWPLSSSINDFFWGLLTTQGKQCKASGNVISTIIVCCPWLFHRLDASIYGIHTYFINFFNFLGRSIFVFRMVACLA